MLFCRCRARSPDRAGIPAAAMLWFFTRIFPLSVGDGVLDVPNVPKSSHAFADNFAACGQIFPFPAAGWGILPYRLFFWFSTHYPIFRRERS